MRNHKNRPPVVRKVVEVRVDGRRCVWARPTVADVYAQVLQTEAMMETAKRLYQVHAGSLAPFSETPDFIVGMERGGDEW